MTGRSAKEFRLARGGSEIRAGDDRLLLPANMRAS
jgi:hypothetical protein